MDSRTQKNITPTVAYHKVIAAAGVNATLVSAGAIRVHSLLLTNTTAAVKFVKIYNKATAPSEADTPILTLSIPANGNRDLDPEYGMLLSLGFGYRITGAAADADTTAVSAGDVILNTVYRVLDERGD